MIKRRPSKRTKLKILLVLFVCVFVCAISYLGYILYGYINQKNIETHIGDLFDDGLKIRETIPTPTPPPPTEPPDDPGEEIPESEWAKERRLLLEEEERGRIAFTEILEINEDFLGMIEIPGLVTRQPYVHSKNNEEYLDMDFNGKKSQTGTIFLNAVNDRLLMDYNNVIFGHHTNVGTMFARLGQYKNAETFKKSPIVILDGLIGESIWIVFAAHVTEPVPWYTMPLYDKDEYADHLEEIKARSLFITDVDVTLDDRILTLSVCDYSYEDMRFIVHARKLRPGEKAPEEVIAEKNPNVKPYTVPFQQTIKDIDMSNAVVSISQSSGKLIIYQARSGGVDRYVGDTHQVQGPFATLTHSGIKSDNFMSAVIPNVREDDENENARQAYLAVQGVGGGQGITLFSANFIRGRFVEVGLVTPEGVNARFPAAQNNNGLWLLYSVPGENKSSDIYRQPLLGGESELLVTVRRVENAQPLGFYYVNEQWVVIWYEPSNGGINGARFGTREVVPMSYVNSNIRVMTYGGLSGTSVRIATVSGGKLSFASIDLSNTPTGEPIEPEETPEPTPGWYVPPEWGNRP